MRGASCQRDSLLIIGSLCLLGVPKPGWRAFQLLHEAGDHRLPTTLASDDSVGDSAETARSPHDCTVDENTNMAGFTLKTVKADTKAYCCAKCQAVDQQECSFWTFHDGSCVFKSSDAGRVTAPGFTSGSRVPPGGENSTTIGSPLSVFATINGSTPGVGSLQVYLSLWANPKDPSAVKNRTVTVTVKHAAGAGPASVVAWRIDSEHGNSREAWEALGSPAVPAARQLQHLKVVSQINPEPVKHTTSGGSTTIDVPMTGDSAVRLNFA